MGTVTAFNGTKVLLSEKRWKHIVLRHQELEDEKSIVLNTVAGPDEMYIDATGAFHALKRLVNEVSDYLVVIYRREDKEGYKNSLLHKL
jgi:hypothetical protein